MSTPYPSQGIVDAPAEHSAAGPAWAIRGYLILTAIFWVGVMLQAFMAGAGIFTGGSWMTWHTILGHLLSSPVPIIPLLLIILSVVGRLPAPEKRWTVVLFVLALLQPFPLYFRGALPILGALHPLNALFLFALPLYLMQRVRQVGRAGTAG